MRSGLKYMVFAACILLFAACSSSRMFTIEVMEPAPVTIPATAQNLIILNNSVPQPSTQSVHREYRNEVIKDYPIDFDSISWSAVYFLSEVLSRSDFFQNVEVYTLPIRNDDEFLAVKDLKEDVLSDFFEDLDYDIILSVDRLVVSVEESIKPYSDKETSTNKEFISGNLNCTNRALLSCGLYLPNRTTPLTHISVTDSVHYHTAYEGKAITLLKTIPENLIDYLVGNIAHDIAHKILPVWVEYDRILFTSNTSRMKEAYSYTNNNHWKDANTIWKTLLEEKTKPVDKARLTSNIAVALEMENQFEEALKWAEQSQNYFKEAGNSASEEDLKWIEYYVNQLGKRIVNNTILDLQIGK